MDQNVEMIDGAPRDPTPPPPDTMQPEKPEVDPARKARVSEWCQRIKAAKEHFKDDFARMRNNQKLARQGATDAWKKAGNYTVPVAARHINQQVSQLYARNPQARAVVKPRMMFRLWDENASTLQQLQQQSMPGMPPTPEAMAILAELEQVKPQLVMLSRTARTVEYLFNYYLTEQTPSFKQRFKQCVRRAKTCGVAYVELGFQRILEPRPEVSARIEDITGTLRMMETLASDMQAGKFDESDARFDTLKSLIADLQNQQDVVVREGLLFDFPRSTEIIVDPECRELKGFVGAGWIAREFHMTKTKIHETWKVDVGTEFTPYSADRKVRDGAADAKDRACVWYVQHKEANECFVIVDGYCDFITEPAPPSVKTEGFWTTYVLSFNDVEDEDNIYPPSDVDLMEDAQEEINRSRQSLREHRVAARPAMMTPRGGLTEQDKKNIQTRPAMAVIEVSTVQPGQDVKTVLAPLPTNPIDPNLYETGPQKEDVLMAVGSQEANLGPTSDSTATEASIAQASQQSASSSNMDEVDEILTQLARDGAQVLLLNMSAEMVTKIVGPGAVWPEMRRQDIVEEVTLEVKAGSSGRPNRAAKLADMERAMPFILQLPGMNPIPIAEEYLDLLDIDWKKAIIEGLPSITALNQMMSKPAGGAPPPPGAGPQAQGGHGGNNAPQPAGSAPPGQPAYPADMGGPSMPENALQPM